MTISSKIKGISRRAVGQLLLTAVAAACLPAQAQVRGRPVAAPQPLLQPSAMAQVSALLQEKEARSASQQKLDSQLWYALQASRGLALDGLDEVYASAQAAVAPDATGQISVDITARVNDRLLAQIKAMGGVLGFVSAEHRAIRATLPLSAVEALAANALVQRIEPAAQFTTNVGAITGQGTIAHKAKQVVAGGYTGAGVTVGVMSDTVGITAASDQLAPLIASGDLPAGTIAVPGQDGGAGTSEGTAMMEIVADIAPGAKIVFATANGGQANMANNILTLRNVYNCDIIVDDVSYFAEGAFQDGPIAQAINTVVAGGAMYFSSAGNSGNVTNGTSGTWEGDFKAGAASASPLPLGYTLHDFGTAQYYDALTVASTYIDLKWSDPLGASTNDYDLFVVNAAGTTVLCASTTVQNGTVDPLEACYSTSRPVGSRIMVAQKAGAAQRAIRVDTHRGALTIATNGSTFGHNAAASTMTAAAVYWGAARTGSKPFVGGATNPTETFSSDGPRKIFYNPDGTPITPGNLLFGTNGGTTLAKPELSAADGNFSRTPGFLPFFGTSAAAPHAAAVAALVKSARPDYTAAQVLTAMKATALDIRAPGTDQDSGVGIVMAWEAVQYALTH